MKVKKIEENGIEIVVPSTFKIKSKFPEFWAISKNGKLDIAISFQELTAQSYEGRLNVLKSSNVNNPQLAVNVCSNEAIDLPYFSGWLKVIETCLIGTDDWNHTLAFIGESKTGVKVDIQMAGEGLYKETKHMWNEILDSLLIR